MRFELTVALKYLIPKWRQLSVSIISMISVLVISLVVWLVVLFLSVTEGIEKKWIEELVSLNAPVRMSPTEAYYNSYYYQIDAVSLDSNYTTKTIGEKLSAVHSDPYDPRMDRELSFDFPHPDRAEDGRLKDPVKEAFEAINSLTYEGIRPHEYEVNLGNLRLHIEREEGGVNRQSLLTQASYIAAHDGGNSYVNRMVIPPRAEDYNNLLKAIAQTPLATDKVDENTLVVEAPEDINDSLKVFFENLDVEELQTTNGGFVLAPTLFPKQGLLKGIALIRHGQITKVIIPKESGALPQLEQRLQAFGFKTALSTLLFDDKQIHLSSDVKVAQDAQILLDDTISFHATFIPASLPHAHSLTSLKFHIEGKVQNVKIAGETPLDNLAIARAQPKKTASLPFWVYRTQNGEHHIPGKQSASALGEGVLVAKHFQKNGIRTGDRGSLAYYTFVGNSMQEQRIPVYVAGFYDPGVCPLGNKLVFVNPHITAILRSSASMADPMLGNGIQIWLKSLSEASQLKEDLIHSLKVRGIEKYWLVESYHDYELTRPILEQLQSDKHLFTLIAVIILAVACSNIISMLILLVNDKRKEIGILQSMGASPLSIAAIFGLCGFVTGLISCIVGVTAALLTLKNLASLVDFLSFLQGRETFQAAFYGTSLPNELSYSVLALVLIATLLISLLAGIVPAIKASKIRPTEILKSE